MNDRQTCLTQVFRQSLVLLWMASVGACAHRVDTVPFGVQENQASYIPARTAVLPCRHWPNGARIKGQLMSDADPQELKILCAEFDRFVLAGFQGQPYMRGLSPAVVQKLLERAAPRNADRSGTETSQREEQTPGPAAEGGVKTSPEVEAASPLANKAQTGQDAEQPTSAALSPSAEKSLTDPKVGQSGLITELSQLPKVPAPLRFIDRLDAAWVHRPEDCSECTLLPSFYAHSIADRPEWLAWLASLASATQMSDATLIPFVVNLTSTRFDDRGQKVARREATVAMLLIDTNNGALIWSGGRKAELLNRTMDPTRSDESLMMPSTEDLARRIFVEDLWKEFPGRQTY